MEDVNVGGGADKPNSYSEIFDGIIKSIPRWQDAILFACLIKWFHLREFKKVGSVENGSQVDYSGALRVLGIIEKRDDERFQISGFGREFVKWLIKTRELLPIHGAEFAVKYGPKFGRRVVYSALFSPEATEK